VQFLQWSGFRHHEGQIKGPLKRPLHHGTMVPRDLRGPSTGSPLCLSDSPWKIFRSGWVHITTGLPHQGLGQLTYKWCEVSINNIFLLNFHNSNFVNVNFSLSESCFSHKKQKNFPRCKFGKKSSNMSRANLNVCKYLSSYFPLTEWNEQIIEGIKVIFQKMDKLPFNSLVFFAMKKKIIDMRSRIRESKRLNTYHIINWTKRRLYFFNEEYFYIIILLENILSYILMNINSQINVRLRYRILRFYHLEQSPILYFTGEYLNL